MEKEIELTEKHRTAFKKFKESRKLKNQPWAKAAGLVESTIRAFLTGTTRSMKMVTLQSLANAQGVTVAYMLGDETVLPNEDPIRGQLDLAIRLWFNSAERAAIHTLAATAYKALRPMEAEKNLSASKTENLIISCIFRLQSAGERLNKIETAYLVWTADDNPQSIKEEIRTLFKEKFPVETNGKEGKPIKADFFKVFTGNSLDG